MEHKEHFEVFHEEKSKPSPEEVVANKAKWGWAT
jgi:hypothetical protein